MKERFEAADKRKKPIFIDSEADDYGLNNLEFRVYARIARRAGSNSTHTESVPNMAKTFMVGNSSIRRALSLLCFCGLISEEARPGKTNRYTLNDKTEWATQKPDLNSLRNRLYGSTTLTTGERGQDSDPDHGGTTTPTTGELPPRPRGNYEGTPSKVLPKGTPSSRARESGQEEPAMPPVTNVSRLVSKRPALVHLAEGEKLPKEFLFPDRLIATEEIVAFAADHGYEGDDLRDTIESMRMKRLRDDKKYKNERELALDIQYWITQCAQNRDKRREAVNWR